MTEPSQPDTDSSIPIVLEWHSATHNIVDVGTHKVIAREVVRVDGERIVRAVNNHAKLLAALERIAGASAGFSSISSAGEINSIARNAIEDAKS